MIGRLKHALVFTVATYLVSFLLVVAYFAFGGRWQMPGALILSVIYMFVPMAVALTYDKYLPRQTQPLGVRFHPNRWFAVGWLLPPLIALATLGVSLVLPNVEYSADMEGMFKRLESTLTAEQIERMKNQAQSLPVHPFWLALGQGLIAGATINAVAGFGEELGWRGFLYRELSTLGFWKSSLVVGIVWGFWHAPLILQGHNYPEHRVAGVLMMVVFTTLMSPLFSYVRARSESVIAAAIMHGSLNGTAGIPIMVIRGGNDLTVGITGLAGFIVLACANLILCILMNRTGQTAEDAVETIDQTSASP
jgi:membrane protease YdiL (CAAX protease family)